MGTVEGTFLQASVRRSAALFFFGSFCISVRTRSWVHVHYSTVLTLQARWDAACARCIEPSDQLTTVQAKSAVDDHILCVSRLDLDLERSMRMRDALRTSYCCID